MKTIYEITVPVTSQEQADRLKAICVKYGLPIYKSGIYDAFEVTDEFKYFKCRSVEKEGFFISNFKGAYIITESKFLELAKEFKTQ
jgi:hypothetical protein